MKYFLDLIKKENINVSILARELKIDRQLLDRMLWNTQDTKQKPQFRYDLRVLLGIQDFFKISDDEFWAGVKQSIKKALADKNKKTIE